MLAGDLIFVSMEDWDAIWRRNQFVCARLAARHPQRKILFVGVPRSLLHRLSRGDFGFWKRPSASEDIGFPNITLTHYWRVFPNRFAWGRRLNEWLARWHVRREAKRLGLRKPLLWLNPHDAVHMAGKMGESAVIYDVTDDWSHVTQSSALSGLIRAQDEELCGKADAVIVCSEALLQGKKQLATKVHLVPNGVEAEHYRQVSEAGPKSDRWPKPVLGYTGTLHSDRMDIDLIRALAADPGVGSIVLVGPNHMRAADVERLQVPKVFLTGAVPYAGIPAIMRDFDACIVPHLITPFTESLNPIKLWEYLAAGKPIIATPVAGFRDFPELIYLAKDAAGFAGALRQALDEDSVLTARRQAEAAQHSWDARVDAIETILSECVPAGLQLAN